MTEIPNPLPKSAFVTDEGGNLIGHVDIDRLQTDATLLMYALAETAGDDDATNRVSTEWVQRLDPDYFGYVAAAALSLTVRNIVAPVLDVAETVGLDLRAGLKRAAEDARRDLTGGVK